MLCLQAIILSIQLYVVVKDTIVPPALSDIFLVGRRRDIFSKDETKQKGNMGE